MTNYLTALKDLLIVLAPIIVGYISYKSSKKTQKDIKIEVEKVAKEKEAETKQILDKINAELESQKQLISWQNAIPQTNDYTNLLDIKRFGHITALPRLCQDIQMIISMNPSSEIINELEKLLDRIDLPTENEELFPYEVPILLNYKMTRKTLTEYKKESNLEQDQSSVIE